MLGPILKNWKMLQNFKPVFVAIHLSALFYSAQENDPFFCKGNLLSILHYCGFFDW